MRGYLVVLVAAVGMGCAEAPTPTAPGSANTQSAGFFSNGNVQLSYRLDVPTHTGPVRAVVFGHGSGLQTKQSCRVFGVPFFNGLHRFDPKPVLESLHVPGLWLLGGEDRNFPTPARVAILDQLIASGKPYTDIVYPGLGHSFPPNWSDLDQWLSKIQ
jgi:hypothetical protein